MMMMMMVRLVSSLMAFQAFVRNPRYSSTEVGAGLVVVLKDCLNVKLTSFGVDDDVLKLGSTFGWLTPLSRCADCRTEICIWVGILLNRL